MMTVRCNYDDKYNLWQWDITKTMTEMELMMTEAVMYNDGEL